MTQAERRHLTDWDTEAPPSWCLDPQNHTSVSIPTVQKWFKDSCLMIFKKNFLLWIGCFPESRVITSSCIRITVQWSRDKRLIFWCNYGNKLLQSMVPVTSAEGSIQILVQKSRPSLGPLGSNLQSVFFFQLPHHNMETLGHKCQFYL